MIHRFLRVLLLAAPAAATAEFTFDFDIARYERPAYEFSGYLQGTVEHLRLDRDSALYALNFPDRDPGSFERYRGLGELSALYRHEDSTLRARIQAEAVDDIFGTSSDLNVHELYVSTPAGERTSLEIGKRSLRWGTGYAWSPIGFLERPRDPTDPELSREGFFLGSVEYVRSFPQGQLRTVSFTPVILPVTADVNGDFGERETVNVAARLYLLYRDTDIHVTARSDGSRPGALGIGFSRNPVPHMEIHGELAWYDGRTRALISDGGLETDDTRPVDLLLGMRYLTRGETTWIVEYYRNGAGYSRDEMRRFFDLASASRDDPALRPRAIAARREGYGAPQAMRDYLFLRVRKSEPWDALYWSLGVNAIVNLHDGSASTIPEVMYTGFRNTELRGRLAVLSGGRDTEFGERLNDWRLELRARYFF
ncbi:hypothetical protein B1C78_10795 [Thioalkalivibrio denitrificans]|uniref:Porin n=1 Tax=Thioalkalivibrio denitrificans TaxID=108003 RepID=A0A1V3NFP4_9GAMM|nr:hypothetical protein [Thioalkalivibrio denitrificans]OOG23606.1 hypothetical protein B1C78_10795 [Thioalkalivibrio denitrificans]